MKDVKNACLDARDNCKYPQVRVIRRFLPQNQSSSSIRKLKRWDVKNISQNVEDRTKKRCLPDNYGFAAEKRPRLSHNSEMNATASNEFLFEEPYDYFAGDLFRPPLSQFYQRHYHGRTDKYPAVVGTERLKTLCDQFENIIQKFRDFHNECDVFAAGNSKTREATPCSDMEDSDDSTSSKSGFKSAETAMQMEVKRRLNIPHRLHSNLWFNEYHRLNDGPVCRCSESDRCYGYRHQLFYNEKAYAKCDGNSNNALYHYRLIVHPKTNFFLEQPTLIEMSVGDFVFEGLSVFTHEKILRLPSCKFTLFNINYNVDLCPESTFVHFTVRELELIREYLFTDLLELFDLKWDGPDASCCKKMHFLPRFTCKFPHRQNPILLPPAYIIDHLVKNFVPMIDTATFSTSAVEENIELIGTVGIALGKRPSAIRVDRLDIENGEPVIVHFGTRPFDIFSVAEYRRTMKSYRKDVLLSRNKHLSIADRMKLYLRRCTLQELAKKHSNLVSKEVVLVLDARQFFKSGLRCDIMQQCLLISPLMPHVFFHLSLNHLEKKIGYSFENRLYLQLSLTHPSLFNNLGPNPDHVKTALSNCRIRHLTYGKANIQRSVKRGVTALFKNMAKNAQSLNSPTIDNDYERLEFLGDALIAFLVSTHLFLLFPDFDEGTLTIMRTALVENIHLAYIAKERLELHKFIILSHGPDLGTQSDLSHLLANSLEALLAAVFLDGGILAASKLLSKILFPENSKERLIWNNLPSHPLQMQFPAGDRDIVNSYPVLRKLTELEEQLGLKFKNLRLLCKAFCQTFPLGNNSLTHGDNQRLEFLGDAVMNFVVSDLLFRRFPQHHEGYLSLLRSSIVSNERQAEFFDELNMSPYLNYVYQSAKQISHNRLTSICNIKSKADVFEAVLAAIFIDKGLQPIYSIITICFFSQIYDDVIQPQRWNDPKSNLQHCCLTLRSSDDSNPSLPEYKILSMKPANHHNESEFQVGVYFKGHELGIGNGSSIRKAEVNAAKNALDQNKHLFPLLRFQRNVVRRKSFSKQ